MSDDPVKIVDIHIYCGRCGRELRSDNSECGCVVLVRDERRGPGPMGMRV